VAPSMPLTIHTAEAANKSDPLIAVIPFARIRHTLLSVGMASFDR
jgi:hypothetical protein